jgi:DnaJ-class molecular chaperone
MKDPYRALGVSPDADALTIRRAYQKLARRWHPALRAADREAQARFQRAAEAYALLSDPDRRRHWDREGVGPVPARRAVRSRRRAALSTPDLAFRFEELVVELLPEPLPEEGLTRETAAGQPAPDIVSEVELEFAEAVRGVVVSLSVQRESVCAACGGVATDAGSCDDCDGRGIEVDLERVRVRIPSGVADGSQVRVRGQGNPVDGRHGDLFLIIRVRPHEHFTQRGSDVLSEIPITVAEASLGAAVTIPTIHGPVTVQIPKGTRSGQRFRLAGRGITRADGEPGDHYYRVEIVPPDATHGENERLLARLEQADPRCDLPFEAL